MPLVAISLARSTAPHAGVEIGDAVHAALIDALGVPAHDHFQIINRADTLVYDDAYLGIERTSGFLVIQIFLARGRSLEQKQALYKRTAELLEDRCDVRPEDVFISLVEVGPEDFSFGRGIAQYARATPAHLAACDRAGSFADPGLRTAER